MGELKGLSLKIVFSSLATELRSTAPSGYGKTPSFTARL